MTRMIVNRLETLTNGRLLQSPDDSSGQPTDRSACDSDAKRIMIVDDDPVILELVSRMAAQIGYCPTPVKNGRDAQNYLAKDYYDLVITDYDMPLLNGYQLADQIKEKHFRTKVIIMTGNCERSVLDMLNGSGVVNGLLLKPFDLKTMKEKIEMVDI